MVEASVRDVCMCTGVRILISTNLAKIKSKVFLELTQHEISRKLHVRDSTHLMPNLSYGLIPCSPGDYKINPWPGTDGPGRRKYMSFSDT